jgi:hypothetical protein
MSHRSGRDIPIRYAHFRIGTTTLKTKEGKTSEEKQPKENARKFQDTA